MTGKWMCRVTPLEVERIAEDIDKLGYGVIRNYVSAEEVRTAHNLARAAVEASDGEYVCFQGPEALSGTVLGELAVSASFKALCHQLYELGTGRTAPNTEFHQILRCLHGQSGQLNSNVFHYDSYVVTALLPIAIPKDGGRGDLLMFPNIRRLRKSYLSNVIDKAIIDNKISHAMLLAATRRKVFRSVTIKMNPGDIYFFWGYRSIHTNEPCDADKLRATALFHFGDPHEHSQIRTLIRRTQAFAFG